LGKKNGLIRGLTQTKLSWPWSS